MSNILKSAKRIAVPMFFLIPVFFITILSFKSLAAPTVYELYVGGMQINSDIAGDLTVIENVTVADGGYARFEEETHTLFLKDATIVNGTADDASAILYTDASDFTIKAEGMNVVKGGTSSKGVSAGLSIGASKSTQNLTINVSEGASLTFLGGKGGTDIQASVGIRNCGLGTVTIHADGILTAEGKMEMSSCGLDTKGSTVLEGKGTVNLKAVEGSDYTYGFHGRNIDVNLGKLNVTAGNANIQSWGMQGEQTNINGGEITVTAGNAPEVSVGIFAYPLTVNEGIVTVTSGDSEESFGVHSGNGVSLRGSAFEVTSGVATKTGFAVVGEISSPSDITIYASTSRDGETCEVYNPAKADKYKWIGYPVGDVIKNENGKWVYYKNGKANTEFYGFLDYSGSRFLVANGEVVTSKNGIAQDPENKDDWYFCVNGQVVTNKSGLVQYPAQTDNWFIVENGKLDTTYSGFADYNGGKFFVARGKLVRKDGLVQDPNNKEDWYFLSKGQVQKQKTGVVIYNKAGFYVTKGKLDTSYTGKAQYSEKAVNIVKGRMQ